MKILALFVLVTFALIGHISCVAPSVSVGSASLAWNTAQTVTWNIGDKSASGSWYVAIFAADIVENKYEQQWYRDYGNNIDPDTYDEGGYLSYILGYAPYWSALLSTGATPCTGSCVASGSFTISADDARFFHFGIPLRAYLWDDDDYVIAAESTSFSISTTSNGVRLWSDKTTYDAAESISFQYHLGNWAPLITYLSDTATNRIYFTVAPSGQNYFQDYELWYGPGTQEQLDCQGALTEICNVTWTIDTYSGLDGYSYLEAGNYVILLWHRKVGTGIYGVLASFDITITEKASSMTLDSTTVPYGSSLNLTLTHGTGRNQGGNCDEQYLYFYEQGGIYVYNATFVDYFGDEEGDYWDYVTLPCHQDNVDQNSNGISFTRLDDDSTIEYEISWDTLSNYVALTLGTTYTMVWIVYDGSYGRYFPKHTASVTIQGATGASVTLNKASYAPWETMTITYVNGFAASTNADRLAFYKCTDSPGEYNEWIDLTPGSTQGVTTTVTYTLTLDSNNYLAGTYCTLLKTASWRQKLSTTFTITELDPVLVLNGGVSTVAWTPNQPVTWTWKAGNSDKCGYYEKSELSIGIQRLSNIADSKLEILPWYEGIGSTGNENGNIDAGYLMCGETFRLVQYFDGQIDNWWIPEWSIFWNAAYVTSTSWTIAAETTNDVTVGPCESTVSFASQIYPYDALSVTYDLFTSQLALDSNEVFLTTAGYYNWDYGYTLGTMGNLAPSLDNGTMTLYPADYAFVIGDPHFTLYGEWALGAFELHLHDSNWKKLAWGAFTVVDGPAFIELPYDGTTLAYPVSDFDLKGHPGTSITDRARASVDDYVAFYRTSNLVEPVAWIYVNTWNTSSCESGGCLKVDYLWEDVVLAEYVQLHGGQDYTVQYGNDAVVFASLNISVGASGASVSLNQDVYQPGDDVVVTYDIGTLTADEYDWIVIVPAGQPTPDWKMAAWAYTSSGN